MKTGLASIEGWVMRPYEPAARFELGDRLSDHLLIRWQLRRSILP